VAETVVWNDPKISAINEVERTALQPSSFRPGNKASDLSSRSHPQIAWVASRWATCSPYLASPGPLTKPVEFVVLKFGEWDDGIIPSFPAHAAAQAKVPRTVQLLTSAAAGCRKNNFKTFRMGWMARPSGFVNLNRDNLPGAAIQSRPAPLCKPVKYNCKPVKYNVRLGFNRAASCVKVASRKVSCATLSSPR
jgi:hypothetical protein